MIASTQDLSTDAMSFIFTGGLLTSRYSSITQNLEPGTRFAGSGSYRQRYWQTTFLDALNDVKKVLEPLKIDIADAAIRWLKHHSCLNGEKGVFKIDAMLLVPNTRRGFSLLLIGDGYILGGSNGYVS